jgi:hypothetical protein
VSCKRLAINYVNILGTANQIFKNMINLKTLKILNLYTTRWIDITVMLCQQGVTPDDRRLTAPKIRNIRHITHYTIQP